MTAWTMAIPGVPALQMVALASKLPTQVNPLLAPESGAEAFGLRLTTIIWMLAPRTARPEASLPVALNTRVPPTSMEKLEPGFRVTDCTPPLLELLLLLPRQPVRARTKVIANVRRRPGPQRYMNPPRARLPGASILLLGGKLSV